MKVSFYGGAGDVTGACHLFESRNTKLLIDCGLFQGERESEDMNFERFAFDPRGVDALLVTHAHLDHVGRIPKLVAAGFRGTIFSTAATRDLARPLLEDALRLDARDGESLYRAEDLRQAFARWEAAPYGESRTTGDIAWELRNAGHILGSAMIRMNAEGNTILHTGDLGNAPSVLLPPPERFSDIQHLFIESTYGRLTHEGAEERAIRLERAVEDAVSRGGTLVIPAFATERTQDILHLLNEMLLFKRIPDVPVFVDSPLAIRITEIYEKYPQEYRPEIRDLFGRHPHLFRSKKLRFTESADASRSIADVHGSKIIIAGSGMMQGGRILHHLRRFLPDEKSLLLVVGYQAAGSLGRRLIDGAERVRVMGEDVPVRAEIRKISGFSAHADFPQLYEFTAASRDALQRVFAIQGEEASAGHLAQQIRDRLGIAADVPARGQTIEI